MLDRKDRGSLLKTLRPPKIASKLLVFVPLFFFLLIIPGTIFGTVEIGLYHYWDSLEVTEVEDLSDSGTVKLLGIIDEDEKSTVIGIHETNQEVGYGWEYDPDGGHFNFTDGTGTVNVSWMSWYKIVNGTHSERTKHRELGKAYRGGDTIMIVGTVRERNGEKYVSLLYAAPGKQNITPSRYAYFFISLIWMLIIGYYGWVGKRSSAYARSHWPHVSHLGPNYSSLPPRTSDGRFRNDEKSTYEDITWHQNQTSRPQRWRSWLSSLIIFTLALIPLVFLFERIHMRNDYSGLMWFSGIYGLMILLAISAFLSGEGNPVKVGVSNDGIHMIYSDPYVQLQNIGFIPWERVKRIGTMAFSDSNSWIIRRTKGENVSLDNVEKEIQEVLYEEWRKRNPDVKLHPFHDRRKGK